jgi:hypothetical protein
MMKPVTTINGHQTWFLGPPRRVFRLTKWRWENGYYAHKCSPYGTMSADSTWVWESDLTNLPLGTDDEAIRAFAVSMALELDVNVDRAERAVRNLIARGLIERSAESHE